MDEFINTVYKLQEASKKFLKSQLAKGAISRKEYERLIASYPFLKDQPKKAWSKKKLLAFSGLGALISVGMIAYGVLSLGLH